MNKETLEHLLCITGYLPPRNEEELMEFEKECDKVKVKQIPPLPDSIVSQQAKDSSSQPLQTL